jgi:hypothetical protein
MCVGIHVVGRHSVVGVATRYEVDGPGIESHRGRDFCRTRAGRPWGPLSLLYNGHFYSSTIPSWQFSGWTFIAVRRYSWKVSVVFVRF